MSKTNISNHTLEKWLTNELETGKLVAFSKLPSVPKLQEKFNLSKMTVLKMATDLKKRGVLITIPKKGMFVSPFYQFGLENSNLGFDKSKVKTFDSQIQKFPKQIQMYLSPNVDLNLFENFVRIYYNNKNEIVAYSVNWLNKEASVKKDYIIKNNIFELKDLLKPTSIVHKVINTDANRIDKQFFYQTNLKEVQTIFAYFFNSQQLEPVLIRMTKCRSSDFMFRSIKTF